MLFKRFWNDRNGGAAPMLAVPALPLFGAVAAAVDYGRVAAFRTEMQSAVDATALMLSKEAQGMSATDIGTKADAYFKALFTNPQATNVQVTQQFATPQAGNFSLQITASASVSTMFAQVLGQSSMTFSAFGDSRRRLASSCSVTFSTSR